MTGDRVVATGENFRFSGRVKYICVDETATIACIPQVASGAMCQELVNICEACGFRQEANADYVQATVDLEVDSAPEVREWLLSRNLVSTVKKCILSTHCVDIIGFDDVFVVKYDATSCLGQSELRLHVDGGEVSFMLALSSRDQYTGGGTYFQLLENTTCPTVHLSSGDLLVFNAELYHAGLAISSGLRYLLVGFCVANNKEDCSVNLKLEKIY